MIVYPGPVMPLVTWVSECLPPLNEATETHEHGPDILVRHLQPWIEQLSAQAEIAISRLTCWEARGLLQVLGFGLSSVERHYQACQVPPGMGLAQFAGIDQFLTNLAVVAKHPPRDTHYTYWLWNDQPTPLLFTGDTQELFFNQATVHTDQLHTASCQALRPICQDDLAVDSPTGLEALHYATQNHEILYRHFRSFMERAAPDGQRNMEPLFFMTRMRTYLPTYPIQGVVWEGVNAANVASQMQLDYLIGTVDQIYQHTVEERLRFLTAEDQGALVADQNLPSLTDCLLAAAHLTADEVAWLDKSTLAKHLTQQQPSLREALSAYAALVKSAAHLTAMHWALIQNYLIKPVRSLSQENRSHLPVDPYKGTGGKTHAETHAIMEMRRNHPLVGKLVAGVHQMDEWLQSGGVPPQTSSTRGIPCSQDGSESA